MATPASTSLCLILPPFGFQFRLHASSSTKRAVVPSTTQLGEPSMAPKKPEPEPEPEEAEEAAEPETGSSAFVFADGSKYDGSWMMVNGVQMRHGKGVYMEGAAEEQSYDGEWHEDMMQGRGIFSYVTGAQYEGEFAANKYNGHGTFRFPDGAVYVGSFKDNQMHGKGTYTDAQGVEWTGKFFNGTGPGLSNGSVVAK